MSYSNQTAVLLVFLIVLTQSLHAKRILFILPLASQSETHLFIPLAKELAVKGHDITFVSPAVNLKMQNFKQINPLPAFQMSDFQKTQNPLEGRLETKQSKLLWIMSFDWSFISLRCHTVYKNAEFQKLLRENFDLLIISANFNNCFDGLVHKFQAPFISFNSLPVTGDSAKNIGLRMPPSYVPNSVLEFSDSMTFWERFTNTLFSWICTLIYQNLMAPQNELIYRQYLGQDYPSMLEIERNVSLIFSNSHFSINVARPTLPDLVEIGGIHCREAKPLPKELDDFLSGAKDGFIFFSLGSLAQGISLPEETRKIFRNVFSRLKQRVLWKWETEEMQDLPSNVKLGKWLPQQDILGHKNIRIFISHGGLLSTQESAYHGVPILGIPLYVDQDVNMIQAKKKGFSLSLEILDLTEDMLENAIKEMLENPKFLKNAKEISKVFKEQPQPPLDTAVFWTEYVLNHNGATQLRSAARNLNSFQYHSFDVITLLASLLLIIISILVKAFKLCCCRKKTTDNYSAKRLSTKKKN